MHRTASVLLSAVAVLAAALGLGGCTDDSHPAAPTSTPAAPLTNPSVAAAPLPPPADITDVLTRLADEAVPGSDKVGLVEYGTPGDAAAIDRFSRALRDGGFAPLTFDAQDMAWSPADPGNVVATIVATTAAAPSFTYPMEFSPSPQGWQLTRRSADQLLTPDAPSATAPPR